MSAILDEARSLLLTARHAAIATLSPSGAPHAAVVGTALGEGLELVFDTLDSTRKLAAIRRDGRVAVVAWHEARTVQLEGVASEPSGAELARCKAIYLAQFPDGADRLRWPGITWVHVRPTWARLSDFSGREPRIVEIALG